MRFTLFLLIIVSSAAAQTVTDETHQADDASASQRHWSRDFMAPWTHPDQLRQKFLADPSVGSAVKRAIEQRVVIVGMCPFEATAAAGLPLHHVVQGHDKMLTVPPPLAIAAQCKHPDDTLAVELLVRNATQYHAPEPVIFRVRFESGRAVFVDLERRLGFPHVADEET